MTNEIKALTLRVEELQKQLAAAKNVLHAAQCGAAGVAKGDIVKDLRGREFKVSRIEIWGSHSEHRPPSASLYGFKKTKDDWSKRDQYIGVEWKKQ